MQLVSRPKHSDLRVVSEPARTARAAASPVWPAAGFSTVVMFFVGEYDIFDKGALRAALERLVDVPNVVLDLTEVRYVDSTAIGEFIRLHNERASRGGARETIVTRSPNLLRLFAMIDLSAVFAIVENLEDAVRPGDAIGIDYAAKGKGS